MDSIHPCRKYLEAIAECRTPANLTDVRSWFGLINQVAYTFAPADGMHPFRKLLKAGAQFHCDEELESLFQESKVIIAAIGKVSTFTRKTN